MLGQKIPFFCQDLFSIVKGKEAQKPHYLFVIFLIKFLSCLDLKDQIFHPPKKQV